MRVISGSAKGRRLKAPPGQGTRPITDMIKGALFNVLHEGIKGADILDIFAGSGNVGLEALSRGAGKAVFVERNPLAVRIIKENLHICKFDSQYYAVYQMDAFKALQLLKSKEETFSYIYIDPPFKNEKIFSQIMTELGESGLLKPEGIIIIRTRKDKELSVCFPNLIQYRYNRYGESILRYYRLNGEES